jgi:flagellar basal-body rod protein FlgB
MSVTSSGHLKMDRDALTETAMGPGNSWDQAHSGNTVSIESELMTAGQTSRMMSLDTAITRSFHRMLLSSLKV